jgi:hypothetical protein
VLHDVGPRTPFHADGWCGAGPGTPPGSGSGRRGSAGSRVSTGSRRSRRTVGRGRGHQARLRIVSSLSGRVRIGARSCHQARLRISGLLVGRRDSGRAGRVSPGAIAHLGAPSRSSGRISAEGSHQARLRIAGLLRGRRDSGRAGWSHQARLRIAGLLLGRRDSGSAGWSHQARLRTSGLLLGSPGSRRAGQVSPGAVAHFGLLRGRRDVCRLGGFTRRGYALLASFPVARTRVGLSCLTRRGYARQASSSSSDLVGPCSSPGAVAHHGLLGSVGRGCGSPGTIAHLGLPRLVVGSVRARFVCPCSPGAMTPRLPPGCKDGRSVAGSHRGRPVVGPPVRTSRAHRRNGSPRRGRADAQLRPTEADAADGDVPGRPSRGRARRPPPHAPAGGNDRGGSGDQPVTGGPGRGGRCAPTLRATTAGEGGYGSSRRAVARPGHGEPAACVTQSSHDTRFGTVSGHPDRVIV